MKRKQSTQGLARGRTSAKSARAGRTQGKMAKKTRRVGPKAKSAVRAKSSAVASPKSSASRRRRTGVMANAKSSVGGRGLVKALSRTKGMSPVRSTSEMRAKRASRAKAPKSKATRSRPGKRGVSTSTKPSLGRIAISDIQRRPVDERLSPVSDKPYSGADAFKPEAKGADTLMSAPPRKPIRQSRNQVGVRHH